MNAQVLLELCPLLISLGLSVLVLNRMKIYTSSGSFFASPDDILNRDRDGVVEIGGLSIFPILIISACLTLGISRWLHYYAITDTELGISGDRVLQVLAGCSVLFIVGLKNDVHGAFSHTKFLALLAATAMFPLTGLWIRDLQGLFGIHELSPWVGIPLTMVLAMYITDAIVLLDDLDGLGMGLSTILLAIFLGFSAAYGFTLGIILSGAALGVTLPYTTYKLLHPEWRKTLAGNAGSFVVGYILCYLSLSLIAPAGIEMPEGTIMIIGGILIVPMLDIVRMIRSRVRERRSMLKLDRNIKQNLLMIILFAAINTTWVLLHGGLTALFVTDIVLWMALQVAIRRQIKKREEREDHAAWDTTYGREAWESERPKEKTGFIEDGMSPMERHVKRGMDIAVASAAMVVGSPLYAICYLLIKADDGGPAIYKQERIGMYGKPFEIYKFRSMREDAEECGPALSHKGGLDDERLTRVGKFLRKHHLDELPQLWNVVKGDMSLVGYRPERQYYIDQIMKKDPRYSFLYQMRPGVTSYATLYNGYTDTMEKMLRRLTFDLYYLNHRSFWFDMRILWDTFLNILFGKEF